MKECIDAEIRLNKILTDSQRNTNIDLIRAIACFAIVGLHSFAKDEAISSWIYYVCGFAVPFFFMASGYFLLNRGMIQWMYCVNKILGIIKIFFCWNALIILLKWIKSILAKEQIVYNLFSIPIECIKSFVQRGNMWQLWYLGGVASFVCKCMDAFSAKRTMEEFYNDCLRGDWNCYKCIFVNM